METIKTAVVVVLLLAVLYGVYVVLNKPELAPPPDVVWQEEAAAPLQIEMGGPSGAEGMQPLPMDQQPAASPQAFPAPQAVPGLEATEQPPQGGVLNISDTRTPEPAAPAVPEDISPPPSQPPPGAPPSPAEPTPEREAMPAGLAPEPMEYGHDTVASAGPAKSGPAEPPAGAAPTDSIYANPANLDAQDTEQDRSLRAFDAAWAAAVDQLENEQWSDALLTLSGFYNDPELTFEEHQRLIDLLDPLAGKVIYSTEHLLAEPYRARPGETIHDIAQQFQVPVTLLQNINGIADANAVPAGTTLKVVPGPFRAEVDLRRSELVLFLADHYAGRFSVSVGNDPAPQPAEYEVLDKQIGHEYVAPDGARIPPGAPDNPYGNWWIDLGKNTAVHGSPDTIPAHGGLGCLSLSTADASDVYGILTVGSKVLVR